MHACMQIILVHAYEYIMVQGRQTLRQRRRFVGVVKLFTRAIIINLHPLGKDPQIVSHNDGF